MMHFPPKSLRADTQPIKKTSCFDQTSIARSCINIDCGGAEVRKIEVVAPSINTDQIEVTHSRVLSPLFTTDLRNITLLKPNLARQRARHKVVCMVMEASMLCDT
jgi:hypothetical protein